MKPSLARMWGTQKPLSSAIGTVAANTTKQWCNRCSPIGFEPALRVGLSDSTPM
jgi:hypothetical protein